MQAPTFASFEHAVSRDSGASIQHLRESTLDGLREEMLRTKKTPLSFASYFPFLGRGNILHADQLLSHAEVERALDKALK